LLTNSYFVKKIQTNWTTSKLWITTANKDARQILALLAILDRHLMHYEGNYSSWLKLLAQPLGKTKEVVAWEHHLNGGQARRQLQHQKTDQKTLEALL
jgi:hypothetical protein